MKNKQIQFTEITSGSYAFDWGFPNGGFQLADSSEYKPARFTTGIEPLNKRPPWLVIPKLSEQTVYCPLQIHGLHRKFASLHSTESINKFANQFGLLDKPVMLYSNINKTAVIGESVERWKKESREMGVLLAIWDLVKQKDSGKLGQIFIWLDRNKEGFTVAYGQFKDELVLRKLENYDQASKTWQVEPDKRDIPELVKDTIPLFYSNPNGSNELVQSSVLLNQWSKGEVVGPANYYVCREVNSRLDGHISLRILPLIDNNMYLFPDSLLSAMWLMFFNEITGTLKFRQCGTCGDWGEVHIKRSSYYCSDACKQKAYRNRKSESDGKSVNTTNEVSKLLREEGGVQ